jgi:hypothetical protein
LNFIGWNKKEKNLFLWPPFFSERKQILKIRERRKKSSLLKRGKRLGNWKAKNSLKKELKQGNPVVPRKEKTELWKRIIEWTGPKYGIKKFDYNEQSTDTKIGWEIYEFRG